MDDHAKSVLILWGPLHPTSPVIRRPAGLEPLKGDTSWKGKYMMDHTAKGQDAWDLI